MRGARLDYNSDPRTILLEANQDLEAVCQEGWIKVDLERAFPTFTTSRPRSAPGRKPAGIHGCTAQEVARWERDNYRYPPYQFANRNLLINKRNELRLLTIEEKEIMMNFPIQYTLNSVDKKQRGSTAHSDLRHTLIGNSWSVPVIAWLMAQLFGRLGFCPLYTPQQLMDSSATRQSGGVWCSSLGPKTLLALKGRTSC